MLKILKQNITVRKLESESKALVSKAKFLKFLISKVRKLKIYKVEKLEWDALDSNAKFLECLILNVEKPKNSEVIMPESGSLKNIKTLIVFVSRN